MRLIGKIVLLAALVAAVEGLILMAPGSRAILGDTYVAAWTAKHRRLLGPGDRRLVLTGGSNLAFGVDSSRLNAAVDRDTINLGLHGGLGLALMVHEIEDGARPGDLVVLIPEYEHFYGDMMNGELPAAELLRHDWTALPYLSSWRQRKNLVKNSVVMLNAASMALLEKAKATLLRLPEERPYSGTIYRRDAFDVHGDVIGNSDRASLPDRVAASNGRIRGEFNQAAIDEIVRCAEILSARGVEFVVIYPSVSASYWAVNHDLAERVAARMPRKWTRTTPAEWVFDDWLFYDSSYHLNQSGRELRTSQLIGVLQSDHRASLDDDRRPATSRQIVAADSAVPRGHNQYLSGDGAGVMPLTRRPGANQHRVAAIELQLFAR
jgi:hypothetical protein